MSISPAAVPPTQMAGCGATCHVAHSEVLTRESLVSSHDANSEHESKRCELDEALLAKVTVHEDGLEGRSDSAALGRLTGPPKALAAHLRDCSGWLNNWWLRWALGQRDRSRAERGGGWCGRRCDGAEAEGRSLRGEREYDECDSHRSLALAAGTHGRRRAQSEEVAADRWLVEPRGPLPRDGHTAHAFAEGFQFPRSL